FSSVRDTLAHCIGAEWVWRARWEGEAPTGLPDTSGFADLAPTRRRWNEEETLLRAFVQRLDDAAVERVLEYKTFDGKPSAQPFWQMLQHLVNHGSYHRGQVTTMLRQMGAAAPKSMDLIAYYRLKGAAV